MMKTGDHRDTAVAIAKEIGMIGEDTKSERPEVLTEQELLKFSARTRKAPATVSLTVNIKASLPLKRPTVSLKAAVLLTTALRRTLSLLATGFENWSRAVIVNETGEPAVVVTGPEGEIE